MFNLETIIRTAGYAGLFGIVFAETGLLVGFFLPGDSLLFTAGILSGQGFLNIFWLCLVLFLATLLGDNVGYQIGKHAGPKLFSRPKSRLFNPEHLKRSHDFFEKHGGKAVVIARFVPVVRTFSPVVSGVARMPFAKFILYSFDSFNDFLCYFLCRIYSSPFIHEGPLFLNDCLIHLTYCY
jgi:membrane-associated protein